MTNFYYKGAAVEATPLTKPLLTSDNYSIQNLHSHQDVTHHDTTSLPYHTLTYNLTQSLGS